PYGSCLRSGPFPAQLAQPDVLSRRRADGHAACPWDWPGAVTERGGFMSRHVRSRAAGLVAASLSALLLSGCGSDASSPTTPPAPAPPASPSPTPAPAPTPS